MLSRIRVFDPLSIHVNRFSCFSLLALVAAACNPDGPTSPEQKAPIVPNPPVEVPKVPGTTPLAPAISGVYVRVSPSSVEGTSRYVFYDDSTFGLQYTLSRGVAEYRGKYTREGSVISFSFEGWSLMGDWMARGTLEKNDLTVTYNLVMLLTDFEDGVYRLSPAETTMAGIYIADADGSKVSLLTAGDRPSWSRDGKRLVFHGSSGVHVIDVTGANETALAFGGSGSWSPDGKRIVFDNTKGIAVMDADGSNIKLLVPHDFRTDTYKPWDMGVSNPAWSPDGARIAFQHNGDGDTQPGQIYVMNADGSQVRRVTQSLNGYRYAESDPAWTADGASLIFWSYGTGISRVSANGGVPEPAFGLYPPVVYGSRPTQSADGTVAFTVRDSNKPSIWTMASPSGPLRMLIADGYDPQFSPDGSKILFSRR
jgi:Tol biopolymer transport system component